MLVAPAGSAQAMDGKRTLSCPTTFAQAPAPPRPGSMAGITRVMREDETDVTVGRNRRPPASNVTSTGSSNAWPAIVTTVD